MILEPATHNWVCPNCTLTDVTTDPRPHSRMHNCPGLNGLSAPMVAAGTKAKVEAVQREDYLGADVAQTDQDGNVYASVVTTRDDGQDCVVLAPTVGGRFGLVS